MSKFAICGLPFASAVSDQRVMTESGVWTV
jgi:hypothetical protein